MMKIINLLNRISWKYFDLTGFIFSGKKQQTKIFVVQRNEKRWLINQERTKIIIITNQNKRRIKENKIKQT